MKTTLISIVVTAHNIEEFIMRCLNSIEKCLAHSDDDNIEILLIDDNSSDNTKKLMSDFSQKSKYFSYIRTEFGNIGKVRNHAIKLCTGKYITFIDGDDIIPSFNFNYLMFFLRYYSPDILLSRIHEVHNESNLLSSSILKPPIKLKKDNAIKYFLVHKKFQAHLWGKIFKKKLFEDIKIPEISCYEDAYVFPKLLNFSKEIYFTDSIIYNYIKRENSLSMTIDSQKINIMADVIIEMDSIFGDKYKNLVATHAIEHILKNGNIISNENKEKLIFLIRKINKFSYLFNPNV
ncbi:glycosyltransferase family 2 protein [Xenorhabdus thailandensis]|uniref:glycosyltransferase family 2 protein n=1 Tax=Xenorhabdus thailandensis TaxID=3136255 RepID=UPI0030F4745B